MLPALGRYTENTETSGTSWELSGEDELKRESGRLERRLCS